MRCQGFDTFLHTLISLTPTVGWRGQSSAKTPLVALETELFAHKAALSFAAPIPPSQAHHSFTSDLHKLPDFAEHGRSTADTLSR